MSLFLLKIHVMLKQKESTDAEQSVKIFSNNITKPAIDRCRCGKRFSCKNVNKLRLVLDLPEVLKLIYPQIRRLMPNPGFSGALR